MGRNATEAAAKNKGGAHSGTPYYDSDCELLNCKHRDVRSHLQRCGQSDSRVVLPDRAAGIATEGAVSVVPGVIGVAVDR